MYQFIKDISRIECDYITHRDKRHGLYEDLFENYGYEFDLIICPDSASNDVEMCQKLKAMGKDILIIDHHLIEVGTLMQSSLIIKMGNILMTRL